MLKFKIDENLPLEALAPLTQAGHDACTVFDEQLVGASDQRISVVCQREGRALITLDLDFADIRAYPPGDYAGLVVLRLSRLDKHRVLSTIERLLPLFEIERLKGKLWIVEEAVVRIHG
jgi:predicted nuclease of predicted toxin-antitoxin system